MTITYWTPDVTEPTYGRQFNGTRFLVMSNVKELFTGMHMSLSENVSVYTFHMFEIQQHEKGVKTSEEDAHGALIGSSGFLISPAGNFLVEDMFVSWQESVPKYGTVTLTYVDNDFDFLKSRNRIRLGSQGKSPDIIVESSPTTETKPAQYAPLNTHDTEMVSETGEWAAMGILTTMLLLALVNKKIKSKRAAAQIQQEVEIPSSSIEMNYRIHDPLAKAIVTKLGQISQAQFDSVIIELLSSFGYKPVQSYDDKHHFASTTLSSGVLFMNEDNGKKKIVQAINCTDVIEPMALQTFRELVNSQSESNGILITASSISNAKAILLDDIDSSVSHIDGYQLAWLLIKKNIGVEVIDSLEIKKLTPEYFNQ